MRYSSLLIDISPKQVGSFIHSYVSKIPFHANGADLEVMAFLLGLFAL